MFTRRASGRDQHPAADRDRAPHHPRLGRRRRRCLRADAAAQACACAPASRCSTMLFRVAALSAARTCKTQAQRIPHRRWRLCGECRGRDRASRRARDASPARSAGRPATDRSATRSWRSLRARTSIAPPARALRACPRRSRRSASTPAASARSPNSPRRAPVGRAPGRIRRRWSPTPTRCSPTTAFPASCADVCAAARARGIPVVLDADEPRQDSNDAVRPRARMWCSRPTVCARPPAPTISAAALIDIEQAAKSFLAVTDGAQRRAVARRRRAAADSRPSGSTWSTRSAPATSFHGAFTLMLAEGTAKSPGDALCGRDRRAQMHALWRHPGRADARRGRGVSRDT